MKTITELLFFTIIFALAFYCTEQLVNNYKIEQAKQAIIYPYNDAYESNYINEYGELTGEEVAMCETIARMSTLEEAQAWARENSIKCHNF